jgi:hypothetical protein
MRRATSLSEALQGWVSTLSLSKIRITKPRVYLSEQRERETSGSIERFIGTTTIIRQGKNTHKAASTFCPPARGRVRRGGCLLGEGADCQTEVRSGFLSKSCGAGAIEGSGKKNYTPAYTAVNQQPTVKRNQRTRGRVQLCNEFE